MATNAVEEARAAIGRRLKELEDEAKRLRDALSHLGSDGNIRSRRASSARRSSGRRTGRGGQPTRRGQRQAEFLDDLKQHPGAKPAEVAGRIGVSANQAYGLARRLHQRGEVRKRRGGGYVVK